VNPALAVLQALSDEANPVLWIGGEGGMEEELVQRQNIPFKAIPAAGVHGVGMKALPGNLWRLVKGTAAARKIIHAFQPDVMLFTGGYVAAPVAVAGGSIPKLLFVPDIEPGMALKFLARFANRIAVSAEPSRSYFPRAEKVVVTGYPTRPELARWTAETGRQEMGLSGDLPVLLVMGGSKGAHSINNALTAILLEVLQIAQVIHITGKQDFAQAEQALANLPGTLAGNYHPHPYLHDDMGAALASADLAVARAGASTLGEFPQFGLPAILVPYPYAWRYQKVNAEFLVNARAAEMITDGDLSTRLLPALQRLLKDDNARHAMRNAMQSLGQPQASQAIANLVRELAAASNPQGGTRETKPC